VGTCFCLFEQLGLDRLFVNIGFHSKVVGGSRPSDCVVAFLSEFRVPDKICKTSVFQAGARLMRTGIR
jgi:hypothetical protein